MNWYKNLKVRTKLLVAFIIVALFSGIVGGVGITNMNNLNSRTEEMYNDRLVPVADLGIVVKNLTRIKADTYLLIYDEDSTKVAERIGRVDEMSQEDNVILDRYASTYLVPEEEKGLQDLMNALGPYRETREKVFNAVKKGNYEEAQRLRSSFEEHDLEVADSIEKLVSINTDVANKLNQRNMIDFKSNSIIMLVVIVASIALAIALGLIISNIISKPLSQLVKVANSVANNDLDVDIDINTKDEVGVLAKAFQKMADNMNDLMLNISTAAEQVASGSKQVSESSMELSQGATEQASSIEELTASIEEIASQTRKNAENADEANQLAEKAKSNAMQGDKEMKDMLEAMNEINESSNNISKIIKVIDEIAFQTNILALNAAVEAARAGQHGKGFAVVAEEVRNLAARSANAAKETTTMIEGSIKKVEDGTKIANETADALNKIVEGITRVATLVGDIAVASNEQATGIAQINEGVTQVSEVVQSNSATSEETAAASEELSGQSEMLNEMVSKFNLKKVKKRNYKSEEKINPNVLRMLDNISKNKNADMFTDEYTEEEIAATKSKHKIDLSDKEFGKY